MELLLPIEALASAAMAKAAVAVAATIEGLSLMMLLEFANGGTAAALQVTEEELEGPDSDDDDDDSGIGRALNPLKVASCCGAAAAATCRSLCIISRARLGAKSIVALLLRTAS